MRDDVIASQPTDWRDVAARLLGPPPDGKPVWYQKHMTHHMLPEFGRGWTDGLVNAFLIRAPEAVLASYALKRDDFTLDEIGLPAQAELFDRAADRLGRAPPVIEAQDVLAEPARGALRPVRRGGHPFRPGDAVVAARATRDRRRLGAGLVSDRRAVDRLRAAAAGGRLRRPARRPEADCGRGAPDLRPAGGAPAEARRL